MYGARVSDDPNPKSGPASVTATVTDAELIVDRSTPVFKKPQPPLPEVDAQFYRLEQEHARGGLGRILVAHDLRLDRTVAVKELLHVEEGAAQRFVREARLTAKLQHPSIVPVHEAGKWSTGAPFYAMKLVAGSSLKEAIAEARTTTERMALLPNIVAVVDALAYAHSQDIIHRDLKPSNILVGAFGETVVVDWGLAKHLSDPDSEWHEAHDRSLGNDHALTAVGTIMGTPAYMPPEQASGGMVDKRADVYSLGAILYQVLSGQPPFSGTSKIVLERVRSAAPPKLATLVATLPPDLVAIVERSMSRDPAHRYADAAELAVDLHKFQNGRLVGAHSYSFGQLIQRWLRANRSLAAATCVFLVLTIVGTVLFVTREQRLRRNAEASREETLLERDKVKHERDRADRQSLALLEDKGREELDQGHLFKAAVFLSAAMQQDPKSRAYPMLLTEAVRGMSTVKWTSHTQIGNPTQLAYSADGKLLLSGNADGSLNVLDSENGNIKYTAKMSSPIACAAFDPDEARIVLRVVSGGLYDWTFAEGEPSLFATIADTSRGCAFSSDSAMMTTFGQNGGSQLWSTRSGTLLSVLTKNGAPIEHATISPDGRHVAIARSNGAFLLFSDLKTRPAVHKCVGHTASLLTVFFSADSRLLVSSANDKTTRVWSTSSCAQIRYVEMAGDAEFSPDANFVVIQNTGGGISLWDYSRAMPPEPIAHTDGTPVRATFLDKSNLILGVSADGMVRLLDSRAGVIFTTDLPADAVSAAPVLVAVAPGGKSFAIHTYDGSLFSLEVPKDRRIAARSVGYNIMRAVFSNSGALIAGDSSGYVSVVDFSRMTSQTWRAHQEAIWRLVPLPNDRLLTVPFGARPKIWTTDGQYQGELVPPEGWAYSAAISPDGRTIATGSRGGTIHLWDSATGSPLPIPPLKAGMAVVFSPDGKTLATAGSEISLFDVKTMTLKSKWLAHKNTVTDALKFDPTGKALLSIGWDDRLAKLWNVQTGKLIRALAGHNSRLMSGAFSPDGSLVVTASFDNIARIYDAQTGELMRTIVGPTHALAFTPDGTKLAGNMSGVVMLWDVTVDPRPPAELAKYVAETSPWQLVEGRLTARAAVAEL
jgi:eukaryotic-like serine/threonine-protein kinase